MCSPTMCKHVFTHPNEEASDSGRFVCQGCYNGLTGRERGDKRPMRQRSASGRGYSMHWCNVADGIPCDMDMAGCELTGTCDNQVESEHVEVLAAQWLSNDKETRLLQKGLYYTGSGIVAKGTWIATFGILRESTATSQNNRYSLLVRVGESGEIPQGRRQNWSKND